MPRTSHALNLANAPEFSAGPPEAPAASTPDPSLLQWRQQVVDECRALADKDLTRAAAEKARIATVKLPKLQTALPADSPAYAAAKARTDELREKAEAALAKAEARQAAYDAQYGPEAERALARALLDGEAVEFVPKPEVDGLAFEAKTAKAAAELAERKAVDLRRSISAAVRAEIGPFVAELQRAAYEAAERFAEVEGQIDDLFRAMTIKGFNGGDFRVPSGLDLKAYRQALARSFPRPFGPDGTGGEA